MAALTSRFNQVNRYLLIELRRLLFLFQTSNELRNVNEQYQEEIRRNEDQQNKTERVMNRLKADYDARIAVRFT